MPMRRGLLFLALFVTGCTLLTNFDPDGQPCDYGSFRPEEQCLSDAGYWCINGFCRHASGPQDSGNNFPPDDSGTMDSGNPDSGPGDGGKNDGGTGDGGKLDGGDGGP